MKTWIQRRCAPFLFLREKHIVHFRLVLPLSGSRRRNHELWRTAVLSLPLP